MAVEDNIPNKKAVSDRLSEIRNKILNSALTVLSILLCFFLPISIFRSLQTGAVIINYWHILFCIVIWLTTIFRHRIPFNLRIILFLGPLSLVGFLGLSNWGLIGQGGEALFLVCIFLAILTRGPWAIASTVLCLLGIIAISIGVYFKVITFEFDFNDYAVRPSSWLSLIAGFAVISFSAIVALKRFHGFLIDAVENLDKHVNERTIELETANRSLLLSDTVFQNTTEGIMITNSNNEIISINKAFTQITGYTVNEVLGQNPRILKSEIQDKKFYEELWHILLNTGQWKGVFWNKNKEGEQYPQETSINMVKNEEGDIINFVAVFSDITERKQSEEKIEHMATHDSLTKLPNRVLFQDRLKAAIKTAHRNKTQLTIMFIDLDGFKSVNDNLGHRAGDLVLKEVAQRLRSALRESDTVSRFGGDEFIILLPAAHDKKAIAKIAERIISSLSKPIHVKTGEVNIGSSIGIAIYPDHGEDTKKLLKIADSTMYLVKGRGKNSFEFADRLKS